jgi:hypothetical protein
MGEMKIGSSWSRGEESEWTYRVPLLLQAEDDKGTKGAAAKKGKGASTKAAPAKGKKK